METSTPVDTQLAMQQLYLSLRTFRTQLQAYIVLIEQESDAPHKLKFILGWIKHIDNELELQECAVIQRGLPLGNK